MQDLRYSVAAAALGDNIREVPRLSRQMGFGGVQLDAQGALDLSEFSESARRELRHLFSNQEQQIESLRLELGPFGLAPGADVDREIHRLDRAMESARALCTTGAACVCVDLGPLPAPAQDAPPAPKPQALDSGLLILPSAADISRVQAAPAAPAAPFDATFASQVDAALVEIGNLAERYQVTLAMRSELATLGALERALRAARCPWFGVDLDPVAALRENADVDGIFSPLGPWIRHARGRDAVGGSGGRTQPVAIGEGSIRWQQWLAALDEAGFRGWVAVDPLELANRSLAARAGMEHLRRLA